jgi:nucleoside-triphosphatase
MGGGRRFLFVAVLVVMVSGESGCGKTTLCHRVAALARERGLTVAGVITSPCLPGAGVTTRDVEDVRTGERRPLAAFYGAAGEGSQVAAPGGEACGPRVGEWEFHAEGLAWGTRLLRGALPCDLLIIDELGPLELLRGEGWTAGIDLLQAGGYQLALVAVRPALLTNLQERLAGVPLLTLALTPANRDALAGQIMALVGGSP